jgi:6-phosphofructokinase 2
MAPIVTLTMNPSIDKSASVDHVVPDRKLRCGFPQHEPGGGGINVLRAIHKLGGDSLAFYCAGGPPGQMLRDLLDEERLVHHPIQIDGWTRDSLTVYENATGQQFRFGMPGPSLSSEEWKRCLTELAALDPTPEYIVASGSLPPDVPVDFYGRVADLAKERGARMILDTSGEPLRLALQKGVFLIKPNMREFAELAGLEITDERQQVQKATEFIENHQAEAIIVSLGAGGALAVWQEGAVHLRAPTVRIESRVGAGDSMTAGIVLSLARGFPLLEAVRFGVAAGAAAVMTPGTQLCRREDTEKLYESALTAS